MVIVPPVLPVCSGCSSHPVFCLPSGAQTRWDQKGRECFDWNLVQPCPAATSQAFTLTPAFPSRDVRKCLQDKGISPSAGGEIPFPSAFPGEAKWLRSKSWAVFAGECGELARSAGALAVTRVSPSPPAFVSLGVDGIPSRTLQQKPGLRQSWEL